MVITRLSSFYLAIVDPRVDSTTPGRHLGVKMHAHSREATSHLGMGPGVRCRMLDRPQMMWGFHKYRLDVAVQFMTSLSQTSPGVGL